MQKRLGLHDAMWKQVDDYISGALPIEGYFHAFESDLAIDVIENMVGGLGRPYYINTFYKGSVTNMSGDAFLEVCCRSTMEG